MFERLAIAIEDGLYERSFKVRLAVLEQARKRLTAELASLTETLPVVIHPNFPALYSQRVGELEQLLADPSFGAEAMAAIRSLIARIVLMRKPRSGLTAELHGDLARILKVCAGAGQTNERPGSGDPGRLVR